MCTSYLNTLNYQARGEVCVEGTKMTVTTRTTECHFREFHTDGENVIVVSKGSELGASSSRQLLI